MDEPRRGPTIRLPFEYGTRVWHRVRRENVPGIVTGYHLRQNYMLVSVTWADNLDESSFCPYELATEFTPDYTAE